jgi:4-nitrophenyl phosphatase
MPGAIPSYIKSLVLDMDGVLWKSSKPIGNLPQIFSAIQARDLKVAFATNNSTQTPNEYVNRLASFGVEVEPWQIVTSALGVADLLSKDFPSGGKVFAIGETGVMGALRERNFDILDVDSASQAQAVVMGIDTHINFEKMSEATLLVRKGIPFYATNPDKTFPTPRGEIPGAGSWISVITTATEVQPKYAGKPTPYILELARQRLGTDKPQTLVVGDRVETDIAGAQAAQMPAALVLSGISSRQQAQDWLPKIDIIADDLEALLGNFVSQ